MTRSDQNIKFLRSLIALLNFAIEQGIPIRGGEWQRPDLLTRIYSTGIDIVNRGLKLFSPVVGIQASKHIPSLAVDLWITDDTGKKILWADPRYEALGRFWESLGGTWGGRFKKPDIYHMEIKEPVC